jgi:predicted enzyme related to lactoylglutathione lyase
MGALVIFSSDVTRMARFYGAVLDARPSVEASGDIRLLNDRDEVLIHSIPAGRARTIDVRSPPEARGASPVKPVFDVGSLGAVLDVVRATGGVVTHHRFSIDGLTRQDVLDPEGNVIQLRSRTA